MNNRLQFRHCNTLFETRQEAIEYIQAQIRFATEGLALKDKSQGFSLYGEPTVLKYKNEDDATNPHIIIAVGAVTNEGTQYNDNRFCIIDVDKTASDIESLESALADTVKALSVITKDTNSLKLNAEKTEDGTVISGDVAVAESQVFTNKYGKSVRPNIIKSTDEGLFAHVNMTYVPSEDKIIFSVNGKDSVFKINNNYLVEGYYTKKDETLHLIEKDGTDIAISLENLIAEWGVEGEASNTPIVLTREEVKYGDDPQHHHVEPWQDILKADVRIADKEARPYNILEKTSDGRYLYVDGLASKVTYYKDGKVTDMQTALDAITNDVANDSTNIIYKKASGYYASAKLSYDNVKNALTFTTSTVDGGVNNETFTLNAVKFFEKAYYDAHTEILYIQYIDGNGQVQTIEIPITDMVSDWEVQNTAHNVKINKMRNVSGPDIVSADVNIYKDDNNILVDKNHELFVKGTADNIKYGKKSNVEEALDSLNNNVKDLTAKVGSNTDRLDMVNAELAVETERAKGEESRIEGKVDAETARSTAKDNEQAAAIKDINDKIGDGFSITDSVRKNIDDLNAELEKKINDVLSADASVTVEDGNNATKNIKVNVSGIKEDEMDNIITLHNDGLYVGVDLTYDEEKNQLTFNTSGDKNAKVFDLKTTPWDIDNKQESPITLDKASIDGVDRLSADVRISAKGDNILEKGDGVLYVSSSAITANKNDIDSLRADINVIKDDADIEKNTRQDADNRLKEAIDAEALARVTKDTEFDERIGNNTKAITNLIDTIDDEVAKRESGDAELRDELRTQSSSITDLRVNLSSEITDRKAADTKIESDLSKEISDRVEAIDDIKEALKPLDLQGSQTIEVTKESNKTVFNVRIANGGDNIIVSDTTSTYHGIYSTVRLKYDKSANKLRLYGPNQKQLGEEIELSPSSLIEEVRYDSATQEIVIKYTKSGDSESSEFRIPLTDLFNEWNTDNDRCKGISLTKEDANDTNKGIAKLYGEVLISDNPMNLLAYQDEKYLFADKSGIDKALADIECVSGFTDGFADAVFGDHHGIECGDPFHYIASTNTHYLQEAKSMKDADNILDSKVYEAITTLENVSGDSTSMKEVLGAVIDPSDGKVKYPTSEERCLLKEVKSFAEADKVLESAVCALQNMMVDAQSPTNETKIETIGLNKYIKVNTRLSHGKDYHSWGEDNEFEITNYDVDDENTEFTDTNVLRVVDVTGHEIGLKPYSKYNGLYLSNIWDCGEYTEDGEKYKTDESAEAQNLYESKYKNSVRN